MLPGMLCSSRISENFFQFGGLAVKNWQADKGGRGATR